MGIPGIAALMIMKATQQSPLGTRPALATKSAPNAYGEEYREQIIRNVIWRARPRWFGVMGLDICPLNEASAILNIQERNDAFRLLAAYHCVSYWNIPREIRRKIPELIREALTPPDR